MPAQPSVASPVPRPAVFLAITLLVACFVALSRLTSSAGDASLIWPPVGIAYGLVVARGWWYALPVVAGMGLWVLLAGAPTALLPVAAAEVGLGVLAGVLVRERLARVGRGALAATLRFYVAGLGGAAVASALVGSAAFRAAGLFADVPFLQLFLVFWVAEAMGVLVFAGATRVLAADGLAGLRSDRTLALRWTAVIAIFFLVLLLPDPRLAEVVLPLGGLLLVWPAMRARPAFLQLAVVAFTVATLLFSFAVLDSIDSNVAALELLLRTAAFVVLAQLLNAVSVERADMLAREQRLARSDPLTGLGNERWLTEQLDVAHRAGEGGALLAIRLEDMAGAGDLLGATAANALETGLAGELAAVRPGGAARLGPGLYAVLMPGSTPEQARALAVTLHAGIEGRVVRGDGEQVVLRPTLALVETGTRPAAEVLLAMQLALAIAATRTGLRLHVADTPGELVRVRRELLREQEQVKQALQERRLVLYAQPIVPLHGRNEPVHAEILVRLQQPDGSVLPPGAFFPAVERANLSGTLDRYVISELLAWLAAQRDSLRPIGKCAINLTGWSVSDPDLLPFIAGAIREAGVDPACLCFEITESQAIASRETAQRLVTGLRELGASVSLDDFGTGLASFDYLKGFPFDYLKIDGSFVRHLPDSNVDQAIVGAVTQVARTMGLRTIAEFVENDAVLACLRTHGVDYAQGYGVGRPVPLAELFSR